MAINISGTLYSDEGTTPILAGVTLNVSVNGAASAGTAVTSVIDGTFTFLTITAAAAAVLTVYIQDGVNIQKAVTVTRSTGADMTGVDLYQNGLSVRSDNSTVTGTNLNTSDNNGASGITTIYAAASNTALVLASGTSLYVQAGQTFGPGATVVITLPASFSNRGTMAGSGAGGQLTFTGSGSIRTNGGSPTAITINSAGNTYTLADNASAVVWTLTAGTLDVTASNFQINVTNNWAATSGVFVARAGTVIFNGTSPSTHTISGAAGSFNNVTISGTAQTRQQTNNVTIAGNLTISTGTWDQNGKALSLAGDFANSGTFTANSGTVTLNGSGSQTLSGSTTFYNLAITGGSRTVSFTDGTTQTVSNALTLQGAAGQLLTLAGTSTGGWTIAVPVTQTLAYLSVSRSTATGNTAVAGATSTDGGNNVNWTFGSVIGSPGLVLLGVG